MTKVLIIGSTGMLSHTMFRFLSSQTHLEVFATSRLPHELSKWFSSKLVSNIFVGINAEKIDSLIQVVSNVNPDIVINCIGIIRPKEFTKGLISAITINAKFPHQLALLCKEVDARLIHISTDAVFDGQDGMYSETDEVNVRDVYSMTKLLGEVNYPNCITLRTSIVGHELKEKNGLVEWFLAQKGKVKGYKNVIYSGLTTLELAKIISNYVIPNNKLSGLYHVSSEPISKFDLLHLIANRYAKKIEIQPFGEPVIDRSLDSSAFRSCTGYTPPSWPDLVDKMYVDYIKNKEDLCLV
jgi:dTDP-4-dehydrorhamnose reductase